MTSDIKRKEFDEDGFLELITSTIEDAGGTYCIVSFLNHNQVSIQTYDHTHYQYLILQT